VANLDGIEGIGPIYAAKLADAGLSTTDDLLAAGGSPGGRDDIAARTGISGSLILEWVNHADLYRINGVGSEYADLLEAAGVDSVPELAQRNAAQSRDGARDDKRAEEPRPQPAERVAGGGLDRAGQGTRAGCPPLVVGGKGHR
jgi:predicted flap endonuclease-1-like 5' DNA nuclease